MRIERFHQNRKGIILRLIPSSVILVVVILVAYSSMLYPSSAYTQKGISTTYTLNQIERFIEHYNKAQVVIGYELGEVNWSQSEHIDQNHGRLRFEIRSCQIHVQTSCANKSTIQVLVHKSVNRPRKHPCTAFSGKSRRRMCPQVLKQW